MKNLLIKNLVVKGVVPLATVLTLSTTLTIPAYAKTSNDVVTEVLEDTEVPSYLNDYENILSDRAIYEDMARTAFVNATFPLINDADSNELKKALDTFQPTNEKLVPILPQVFNYILTFGEYQIHPESVFQYFSAESLLFTSSANKYGINSSHNYFDEDNKVTSCSWLSYYPGDEDELDSYTLCCFNKANDFYRVNYYPALQKCYVWNEVDGQNIHYEKDIPASEVEDFFTTLNSLNISASMESFKNVPLLATAGKEIDEAKVYQILHRSNTESK